jgi:hypothetical protein
MGDLNNNTLTPELKEAFEKIKSNEASKYGAPFKTIAFNGHISEPMVDNIAHAAYTLGRDAEKGLFERFFNAGISYSDNCFCGVCDYCLQVKTKDELGFEAFYQSVFNLPPSPLR